MIFIEHDAPLVVVGTLVAICAPGIKGVPHDGLHCFARDCFVQRQPLDLKTLSTIPPEHAFSINE